MSNSNTLPIGTLLNKGSYRIDKYLSSGNFGNTYKVTEVRAGSVYAVKEFFLADDVVRQSDNTVTVTTSAKEALFESQKNKFVKEAQRLKSIHHKNIVRVIDYFPENNTWYYVMDFIDGKSLQEWLNGVPFISEEKAMPVFMQLLDGLKHIHSLPEPLLHFDIKPSNIMVDKQGNAYLIDFGSSKHYDEDNGVRTRSVLTGSNAYAPSELLKGRYENLGPWTDIYSLGATLFRMLSNQSPSEVEDNGDAAFAKLTYISSPVKKLILWMMENRWKDRPKSVNEIIDYLRKNQLNYNFVEDLTNINTRSRLDDERTVMTAAKAVPKDDERTIIESPKNQLNKGQGINQKTQIASSRKEELMQSSYGIISTQCSSGSARVVIDNKYCGMTPLKTSVDVGTHVVCIYSNDESRTYSVNVKKGQTVEVRSFFAVQQQSTYRKGPQNATNRQQAPKPNHSKAVVGAAMHQRFTDSYKKMMRIYPLIAYLIFLLYRVIAVKTCFAEDAILSTVSVSVYGTCYSLLLLYSWIRQSVNSLFYSDIIAISMIFVLSIIIIPYYWSYTLDYGRREWIWYGITFVMLIVASFAKSETATAEKVYPIFYVLFLFFIILYSSFFLISDISRTNTILALITLSVLVTVIGDILVLVIANFYANREMLWNLPLLLIIGTYITGIATKPIETPNSKIYFMDPFDGGKVLDICNEDEMLYNHQDSLAYIIGRVDATQLPDSLQNEEYSLGVVQGMLFHYSKTDVRRDVDYNPQKWQIYHKGIDDGWDYSFIKELCKHVGVKKPVEYMSDRVGGTMRIDRWKVKYVAGLIQGMRNNDRVMTNEQAKVLLANYKEQNANH